MRSSHFQCHHHKVTNNNGILIGTVSVPPNPQSTRGIRSRHHHSPLAIFTEKAATVSFPLAFFFSPLFPIIHAAALSIKLLFHQWHITLPQLMRGIRSRCRHPLLVSCVERAVTVSLPLISIFPLTIPIFFSQQLFPIKSLFSRPCQPPSLSQSREQGPATTIPSHEVCGEGGDREFSSCSFFIRAYSFCSICSSSSKSSTA